jgi:hypothetical protein
MPPCVRIGELEDVVMAIAALFTGGGEWINSHLFANGGFF